MMTRIVAVIGLFLVLTNTSIGQGCFVPAEVSYAVLMGTGSPCDSRECYRSSVFQNNLWKYLCTGGDVGKDIEENAVQVQDHPPGASGYSNYTLGDTVFCGITETCNCGWRDDPFLNYPCPAIEPVNVYYVDSLPAGPINCTVPGGGGGPG